MPVKVNLHHKRRQIAKSCNSLSVTIQEARYRIVRPPAAYLVGNQLHHSNDTCKAPKASSCRIHTRQAVDETTVAEAGDDGERCGNQHLLRKAPKCHVNEESCNSLP